jgi:hypothetical protein
MEKNNVHQLEIWLERSIESMEKYNEDMDTVSWGYQNGVLITGNQAKFILEILTSLKEKGE